MLRARLPLSRVVMSCSCVKIPPFMGHPASPFIGKGKAWVIEEEKKKNEIERKASRITGFITSSMRRHHLLVMMFHSVLADVMVN